MDDLIAAIENSSERIERQRSKGPPIGGKLVLPPPITRDELQQQRDAARADLSDLIAISRRIGQLIDFNPMPGKPSSASPSTMPGSESASLLPQTAPSSSVNLLREMSKRRSRSSEDLMQATSAFHTRPATRNTVRLQAPKHRGEVPEENLDSYAWFVGFLAREPVEALLQPKAVGTFVVRRTTDAHVFSVKFKDSEYQHMKIERDAQSGELRISPSESFRSVLELVQFYTSNSEEFSLRTWGKADVRLVSYDTQPN